MRFDILTIFPDFFAPLDLSLMGKAQEAGLLNVHVHDLRNWTEDRHRTVDDTPFGGGAGMVMRPDVWGKAIDEAFAAPLAANASSGETFFPAADFSGEPRRVLAIPTPSGIPLTQRTAENLARADQIVFACGRYEGIDQRVADHYREEEYEVVEFSLGDYVLNGGEVATLVLIEAVGRLLEGFMGNAQSLVEESHSEGGLLEYPSYTRPREWRGASVPQVLLGGDHAAITRWRRDQSLIRTASRRPDLIAELDPQTLDFQDKEVLAGAGKILTPRRANLRIRRARPEDAAAVAELAARTFPLASPDHIPAQDVQTFIDAHLTEAEFARMLAEPEDYRIMVATAVRTNNAGLPRKNAQPELIGYTLTILGGPDGMPASMVRPGTIEMGAAYLSKIYVDEAWHGSGTAGALLERAIRDAEKCGRNSQIVLGTNIANKRAKVFYKRHGFKVAGRRTFQVGTTQAMDDMYVRSITPRLSSVVR